MIKRDVSVNLSNNSDILDLIDKVLAGIFNGTDATSEKITKVLLRVLSINEMPGPYKVIWSIIDRVYSKQNMFITADVFPRDLFMSMVDQGINALVRKHSRAFEIWIKQHNMGYDFKSVKDFKAFSDFLYHTTVSKYDHIVMNDPQQAVLYLEPLCAELKKAALEKSIFDLATVLSTGIDAGKDNTIFGVDDAIQLMQLYSSRIGTKYAVDSYEDDRYVQYELNSLEALEKFNKRSNVIGRKNTYARMYNMQLGILNQWALSGDIIVVVGDEGVGKTKLLIDQAYYAIRDGYNILIICTETSEDIMWNMLKSRHIFETMGMQISEIELMNFEKELELMEDSTEKLKYEEIYTQFLAAETDLLTRADYGRVTLLQNSTYEDLNKQVEEYMSVRKGSMVFIDSLAYLDKSYTADNHQVLEAFMRTLTRCTQELGATFFITTHTSSEATNALRKGKDTGVRNAAGSGHVTKMATLSLLVTTTPELRAQELFRFIITKGRYRDITVREVLMSRYPVCNHYVYDEKMQVTTAGQDNLTDESMFLS